MEMVQGTQKGVWVAGAVGRDKVGERTPVANEELAEWSRQRRNEACFKHSLWLQDGAGGGVERLDR